jgi:hypothetical protein
MGPRGCVSYVLEIDRDYVGDGNLSGMTPALARRFAFFGDVVTEGLLQARVASVSASLRAIACAELVSAVSDDPHRALDGTGATDAGGLQREASPETSTRHSSLIRLMAASVV